MEFLPDELRQVIVGTCGCLLPTDTKPAGYRFVATPTGDKRVAVYACAEHNRLPPGTTTQSQNDEAEPTRKRRRTRRQVAG